MPTFRKKPNEIQAVRWTGDNFDEIAAFAGNERVMQVGTTLNVFNDLHSQMVQVGEGAWLAKGTSDGDYYPIADHVLEADFEQVED